MKITLITKEIRLEYKSQQAVYIHQTKCMLLSVETEPKKMPKELEDISS
jgi:hypothetical protein